jgi:hypothetical protein
MTRQHVFQSFRVRSPASWEHPIFAKVPGDWKRTRSASRYAIAAIKPFALAFPEGRPPSRTVLKPA